MKKNLDQSKYIASVWDFSDVKQQEAMLEPITQENCGVKLRLIRDVSGMSRKDLAIVIGVAESTIYRLESGNTLPTMDFMLRLSALVAIGYARFSNMSESEKKKLAEYINVCGGVKSGIGGAIGAIAASGVEIGLSAAGISSGVAALGGVVLGSCALVASIPLSAGFAGYGLAKGIKAICDANRLNCKEVDGHWELTPENRDSGEFEQK